VLTLLLPIRGQTAQIVAVFVAVSLALIGSGAWGALAGGAPVLKSTLRVLCGGWAAMAVTYGVGQVFKTHVD